MNEVPQEALDLRYNSGGFLPDVGLHRRGDVYFQETSRSHYWLFGILLVAAGVVALLPWLTQARVGELKYWLAGMILFGGLCDILGSIFRRAVTQQVSIDAKSKTVSIVADGFKHKLSWEQIIGLQLCRQQVPGNSEMNGFQLNLVWRETDGVVRRHCLLKHPIRRFVARLGRRYQSLFGFTVMDHTQRQPTNRGAERGFAAWLTSTFGKWDIRNLLNLVAFAAFVGAFFSGFVFWMANSASQEAEHLRKHGAYCAVQVVDKKMSSGGDGSSDNYYVYVRPLNHMGGSPSIQCRVLSKAYDSLDVGQQLKAWVLGTNALLDDGPGNAGSVAHKMLLTCIAFIFAAAGSLVAKAICRTARRTGSKRIADTP